MSPALLPDGTSASKTLDHLDSCLRQILSLVDKQGLGPPLIDSDFDPEILARMKPAQLPSDEIYKNALEAAFKDILYELAVGSSDALY
jgi:THO complex subunit 1